MVVVLLPAIWLIAGMFLLPRPLFSDPFATAVYSREGNLLGARIAVDGQWRFESTGVVSEKFKQALLLFEDQHFYQHPGFNPVSIVAALIQNIKAGEIVRGGSTLTQQVIRISRKGKPRTYLEKGVEVTLAVGLELVSTKTEILQYFADHAPMGGNVVGVEAAAWRYFGHSPQSLSWAEAATLAVLPNAPSLMNPGKNRDQLELKRNRLLEKLFTKGQIDQPTYAASLLEPLPGKPLPLPDHSPHLADYLMKTQPGSNFLTTIDFRLQQTVNRLVADQNRILSGNGIHNAAVVVISVPDNQTLVYVGNTEKQPTSNHQNAVDIVQARRSTGSILKPLLYAAMMEDGLLLPQSLVADIPSYYDNYHPTNFDNHFSGAVPAADALARSLNVPAIFMLRDYGPGRFLSLLHQTGMHSFSQSADHYGLSMILGGGEATLFELSTLYAGMARTVLNYDKYYGKYPDDAYRSPHLLLNQKQDVEPKRLNDQVPLHAGSIWLTYKALHQVNRPESEAGWEHFSSSENIAWKTGTSFGFRDAWAIGTTADYIVGVWVGNADGEGRTGLTGTSSAAPLMFQVFSQLGSSSDFIPPWDELVEMEVCAVSGFKAGQYCEETDTILVFQSSVKSLVCPYHHRIFIDKTDGLRATRSCATPDDIVPMNCFVLPPVQEWYYRKDHPLYSGLPDWKPGCDQEGDNQTMKFVYPPNRALVVLPRDASGEKLPLIAQLTHRNPTIEVFWHLDNEFIGTTKTIHQMAVLPTIGEHILTAVDASGNRLSVSFGVTK